MNFWKNGLSIDETKTSLLILVFFISSIFSLAMYKINGDITDNLLQFLIVLVGSITGINGINLATEAFKNIKGK